MTFRLLRQGRPIAVPPPERAEHFLASLPEDPPGPGMRRRNVLGSGEEVAAQLREVAGEYGAEEVIVVNITYDHGDRRRSYELIADAFGLTGDARSPETAGEDVGATRA